MYLKLIIESFEFWIVRQKSECSVYHHVSNCSYWVNKEINFWNSSLSLNMYSAVTCMSGNGHAMAYHEAESQIEEVKVIKSSCQNVGKKNWSVFSSS